jgi:hypothetical protein
VLVTRERDRLEPRMHAECLEHVPDVVPDCLLAQVELHRDLIRRFAALEETKDLRLSRRERGKGVDRLVQRLELDLAEDPDHAVAAHTFLAYSCCARLFSSGATTEVNCLPRTSPTIRIAAGLTQRMIPWSSIT